MHHVNVTTSAFVTAVGWCVLKVLHADATENQDLRAHTRIHVSSTKSAQICDDLFLQQFVYSVMTCTALSIPAPMPHNSLTSIAASLVFPFPSSTIGFSVLLGLPPDRVFGLGTGDAEATRL